MFLLLKTISEMHTKKGNGTAVRLLQVEGPVVQFKRAAENTKLRKHRRRERYKVQARIEPPRRVLTLLKGLIRR